MNDRNLYGFPVLFDPASIPAQSYSAKDISDATNVAVLNRSLARPDYSPLLWKLTRAKEIAADAKARNFPPECDCVECVRARNLPNVQRILAKWVLK